MGLQEKINANPTVYAVATAAPKKFDVDQTVDEDAADPFEPDEVFGSFVRACLRRLVGGSDWMSIGGRLSDSMCMLGVSAAISMATLIGLCLRVKLLRSLPARFKVDILITPGTHSSEAAVNKQLNDKERVAAALENSHLLTVVNKCIANTDK
ncbi:hypothetical protein BBJ28_00010861 [Nothophytophthora sp. Chile5]|nr:hypothetical protein BBJ28_00010861 [Nothophytophthora sp. Chile5]